MTSQGQLLAVLKTSALEACVDDRQPHKDDGQPCTDDGWPHMDKGQPHKDEGQPWTAML